jgi:hypothetical protein
MPDYKAALYEIEQGKTPEAKQAIEQSLIDAGLILKPYERRRNELRQLLSEYLSAKRRRRTWPKDGTQARTA